MLSEEVDDDNKQDEEDHRDEHGEESRKASHRQTEHQQRDKEEAEQHVENCEPAILRSHVTQRLCHSDGGTHKWQHIPQQNARDVEEQMDQSNLKQREQKQNTSVHLSIQSA